ncbi:hypothetical protein SAMN04515647_3652 [Cohaesibacter sp. ES.047]|uniref:hypothetical protein n=1 Tax=Cohaesibacter sp. ES.047 TaxID=1798205 RepID=UPI000BC0C04E|nr:hypothetical protein [Cohaesibacter sp. ES.047]SNY93357.1 hypothetical protein SAMN04515647_3652 [Cohaesibacter sp. ES.047]
MADLDQPGLDLGTKELKELKTKETLPALLAKAESLGFSDQEIKRLKAMYASHIDREMK